MAGSRWTDDGFLDGLRRQGDVLADETVRRLIEDHGTGKVSQIFQTLQTAGGPSPEDAPGPFREFVEATDRLPPGLDAGRAERGGEIFLRHAFPITLVLLASSLPEGYSAPALTRVLTVSDDLEHHPFKRLMGVVQMLVNVSGPQAFDGERVALSTAQKLRLLHAGVRTVVPRYRPDYEARYGVPVNHEDMLATLMGFSYLVVEGLRRLDLGLTPEEEGDYYDLWRQFALMMGIHPPGRPDSYELIPRDLAEAEVFFDAYRRRQFTGPEANPDGVDLTRVNLRMLERLLPAVLRWLGGRAIPRLAMLDLLGREGMERVGIAPPVGHRWLRRVFHRLLGLVYTGETDLPDRFAERLARVLFQHMIDINRGGVVEFSIPVTVEELRQLA
jgi:hypothetical protein